MQSKVIKLCAPEAVQIPEELLNDTVDEQQIDAELQKTALRYAEQRQVELVAKNDVVYCEADKESYPDGCCVMLYTALDIPCAREAVAEVIGKCIGDSLTVPLNEKNVRLTVKSIVRLVPVEVNDALIASIGIDGIFTVADYREYIRTKMLEDIHMENHKKAVAFVMTQMLEQSVFEYDDAEIDLFLADHMDEIEADYRENDMELPSHEELREMALEQKKQSWLAEEFCRQNDIEIDMAAVEADAEQMREMLEMMGERVPSTEQLTAEALNNAYIMELFGKIDAFLAEKTGR